MFIIRHKTLRSIFVSTLAWCLAAFVLKNSKKYVIPSSTSALECITAVSATKNNLLGSILPNSYSFLIRQSKSLMQVEASFKIGQSYVVTNLLTACVSVLNADINSLSRLVLCFCALLVHNRKLLFYCIDAELIASNWSLCC